MPLYCSDKPAGTAQAVVDKIYRTTARALEREDERTRSRIAVIKLEPSSSPAELQCFVQAEMKRWREIIRRNQIRNQ
jgi:tripartite-type tricarboxylate transporter receptor subunit TctC